MSRNGSAVVQDVCLRHVKSGYVLVFCISSFEMNSRAPILSFSLFIERLLLSSGCFVVGDIWIWIPEV